MVSPQYSRLGRLFQERGKCGALGMEIVRHVRYKLWRKVSQHRLCLDLSGISLRVMRRLLSSRSDDHALQTCARRVIVAVLATKLADVCPVVPWKLEGIWIRRVIVVKPFQKLLNMF